MGLNNPPLSKSKPFRDVIQEGEGFILDGIRVVPVNTADFGEGEMVVMTVRGQDEDLSLFGAYLVAQAKAADASDFGKHYRIKRRVVPDFSKREVKALTLYDPSTDEDIPF